MFIMDLWLSYGPILKPIVLAVPYFFTQTFSTGYNLHGRHPNFCHPHHGYTCSSYQTSTIVKLFMFLVLTSHVRKSSGNVTLICFFETCENGAGLLLKEMPAAVFEVWLRKNIREWRIYNKKTNCFLTIESAWSDFFLTALASEILVPCCLFCPSATS